MPSAAIKQLFEILEEGVFQPVLQSSADQVPKGKEFKLPDLKQATAEQREKFHNCMSDEEIYQLYHEQLASGEADKLTHDLHELNLPALTDCREQVERSANTLFDQAGQPHQPHGAPPA